MHRLKVFLERKTQNAFSNTPKSIPKLYFLPTKIKQENYSIKQFSWKAFSSRKDSAISLKRLHLKTCATQRIPTR
jgi:hypothetical protein